MFIWYLYFYKYLYCHSIFIFWGEKASSTKRWFYIYFFSIFYSIFRFQFLYLGREGEFNWKIILYFCFKVLFVHDLFWQWWSWWLLWRIMGKSPWNISASRSVSCCWFVCCRLLRLLCCRVVECWNPEDWKSNEDYALSFCCLVANKLWYNDLLLL